MTIALAPMPQGIIDLVGFAEDRKPAAAAPAAMADQDSPAGVDRATRYLRDDAPVGIKGQGGDTTAYKVAARCKDIGLSQQKTHALMFDIWNPRCPPGWSYDRLGEKVAHAYRYGFEQPGVADPAQAFQPVAAAVPTPPDDSAIPSPAFSDDACALYVADNHGNRVRHVAKWGVWFHLDGNRWQQDETTKIFDIVRKEQRKTARACNELNPSKNLCSAKTVAAVTTLLKSDRRIAATADQWDADPWLLGTPSGVVDLRTGHVRPGRDTDYITKIAAVAPSGTAAMWMKFLDRVTGGDSDLKRYLQKLAGYALTGSTREQAIFFLYGKGGNGKGVYLNTLSGVMGEYATTASMGSFTATKNERHSTELAMLRGSRLVTAQETEAGRHWDEAKIKALTGGDSITARFMRQDNFTFQPQFSLLIAGNHKPGLRHVDESIRRRMHLVPFTVTIPEPERDKDLPEKLKAEWPGILAWAIDGCLLWQHEGLVRPAAVQGATDEYLAEEDTIGRWLQDRCDQGGNLTGRSAALFEDWTLWARSHREITGSQIEFTKELKGRFQHGTDRNGSFFRGVCLKPAFSVVETKPNGEEHRYVFAD